MRDNKRKRLDDLYKQKYTDDISKLSADLGGIGKPKANKFVGGGPTEIDPTQTKDGQDQGTGGGINTSAVIGGTAAIAGMALDTIDMGERPSPGMAAAKGAASGAAAGAAFGPWGAAVGGVVGGASGYIGGAKAAKEYDYAEDVSDMKEGMQESIDYQKASDGPSSVTGGSKVLSRTYAEGGSTEGEPDDEEMVSYDTRNDFQKRLSNVNLDTREYLDDLGVPDALSHTAGQAVGAVSGVVDDVYSLFSGTGHGQVPGNLLEDIPSMIRRNKIKQLAVDMVPVGAIYNFTSDMADEDPTSVDFTRMDRPTLGGSVAAEDMVIQQLKMSRARESRALVPQDKTKYANGGNLFNDGGTPIGVKDDETSDDNGLNGRLSVEDYQQGFIDNYAANMNMETPNDSYNGWRTTSGKNCINGVCDAIEKVTGKDMNYIGNQTFADHANDEGYYKSDNSTYDYGDIVQFAKTKGTIGLRFDGKVTNQNKKELVPAHAYTVGDKYTKDGEDWVALWHNSGQTKMHPRHMKVSDLQAFDKTGKGVPGYEGVIQYKYDPLKTDGIVKDRETKAKALDDMLHGDNEFSALYKDNNSNLVVPDMSKIAKSDKVESPYSVERVSEIVSTLDNNWAKIGESANLPVETVTALANLVPGIAGKETKFGVSSKQDIKEMVPDMLLPAARWAKDVNITGNYKKNWIDDMWANNGNDIQSRYDTLGKFRIAMQNPDGLSEDELDDKSEDYNNSPRSKGDFQQKELSKRGKLYGADLNTKKGQTLGAMGMMVDNYHKVKQMYPNFTEQQLLDTTVLMYSAPSRALNKEYVNYYIKENNVDYVNQVKSFMGDTPDTSLIDDILKGGKSKPKGNNSKPNGNNSNPSTELMEIFNRNKAGIKANGGPTSIGGDSQLTYFGAGGTHEQNPLGGIPIGTDKNGTPNLVEEGEVKWNDYIFSNRY